MKIYFAGPLFTPYERDYISACARVLREHGIDPFVPHELGRSDDPNDPRSRAKRCFDKDFGGINDANATESAARTIRELAPEVAIVVRTPYEMDKDVLRAVGATQVVTAEAAACDALVAASLAELTV